MDDVLEIKALIKRQFASLSWPDGGTGNWQAFSNDFLEALRFIRPHCQSTLKASPTFSHG
jgi:hypothetical protein